MRDAQRGQGGGPAGWRRGRRLAVAGGLFAGALAVHRPVAFAQAATLADVVQRYYAASNARDLEGVLALFTDDFVFTARTGTPIARGLPAWRTYLVDDVFAHGSHVDLLPGSRVDGDAVTFSVRLTADPLRAAGMAYRVNELRAGFRDGKIATLAVVAATDVPAGIAQAPPPGPAGGAGAAPSLPRAGGGLPQGFAPLALGLAGLAALGVGLRRRRPAPPGREAVGGVTRQGD